VQVEPAAWLTVTFRPATTMVALLLAPAFAVTATVAEPEPVFAPLTEAQLDPDEDVHEHPVVVVTDTVALPEPCWKLKAVGVTV